jgi:hypothetical protein
MDCREISERLIDLLYEEGAGMPPSQAAPVDQLAERQAALAHVASCANCQRQLDELKSTRALFTQLEDKEVPAVISARILAQAVAQSQHRSLWQRLTARMREWLGPLALHPALGLAVVALFVLISSVALVKRTQPTSEVATRGTGPLMPDSHPTPIPVAPTVGEAERLSEDDGEAKERAQAQRLARSDEAKADGARARRSGPSTFAEPPAGWPAGDKKGAAGAPAGAAANSAAPPASVPTVDDEFAALEGAESARLKSSSQGLAAPKTDATRAMQPPSEVAAQSETSAASRAKSPAKSAAPAAPSALGGSSGAGGFGTSGSNAALLSQAKQLAAQGKCAEAVPIFDGLARQGTAYAQSGEAASHQADCLARLARCSELQELSKRTGQSFTSASAACEVAQKKAKKPAAADTDAQAPATAPAAAPSKK